MRAALAAAAAGMLLMLAACGTAAASHTASRPASPAAGPSPATMPATPRPVLAFTCRIGWVDTGTLAVPYAAQAALSAGAFLPDTRASYAAAGNLGGNVAAGFVVTVTNRASGVIPVGGVTVQSFAFGQPSGGPVTTTPGTEPGIGPGETWTFADTFTDAAGDGGTIQVSERTFLHTKCTASVPVSGTLG
jgi:hypothetical protein